MTTDEPTRYMAQRRRLADELRRLRDRAGLSGYELGARLGWSQSKVSKIENLKLGVKAEEAVAAARALGASPDEVVHIEDLLELVATEQITLRQIRRAGGNLATKQRQFAELEKTAMRRRTFSTQIPGLLQLPDQARLAFSEGDASDEEIAAAVNVRIARQQILFDQSRQFEFVLVEQSLRWRSMPTDIHIAQLDRVLSVSTASNVQLGVIPWTAYAPVWHAHSFNILSDRTDGGELLVSYEPLGAEGLVSENSDPERAERFVRAFEALQAVALHGPDLRALITRISEEVRQSE